MTETHNEAQRPRQAEDQEIDDANADQTDSPCDEMPDAPPAKKRRRGAKANSEKKFECKHEGCGKSYSRAEHLYRHQLNRSWHAEPSGPLSYLFSRYPQKHIPL